MSGYATSARLGPASPRLAAGGGDRSAEIRVADLAATVIDTGTSAAAGDTLARRLADTWTSVRERWSQLTFYRFDPESWR